MEIYAKIGTHPQSRIRVGWKRKLLQVGDIIKFKSIPLINGEKWKQAKIDEIKYRGYLLYFLSLY